ncbi:hypothetical protein C2E23DRAFT_754053 [Lenzites betulinus]|nr:hypothetical protein C2E23DRAFT_754053 [Lenzites betulinus]
MIEHRGFSAWITSDNMQLVEFEPRVDEKTHTITCWIAGPVGKAGTRSNWFDPFVVHWRDHGSRVDSASYISVDGYKVPGQFLYGHGEQLRRGVRVGSREERPFVFSKIEAGDSIGYGALKPHKNVGSIMLEIRQVRRTKPYGLLELSEPPSVIRGQRPEGEICVRYVRDYYLFALCPSKLRRYGEVRTIPAQPPTWHISPYDPSSRDPFVTFIFRYRTHACLRHLPTLFLRNLGPVVDGWRVLRDRIRRIPPRRPRQPRRLLQVIQSALALSSQVSHPPYCCALRQDLRLLSSIVYRPLSPVSLFALSTESRRPPRRLLHPRKHLSSYICCPRRFLASIATSLPSRIFCRAAHASSLTSASMSSIPLSQLTTLPTYASSSTSRLKSLYADFTYQKQSNPTSYASNVEWWRRTLEDALLRGWLSESHSANATPDRIVLHAPGVAFVEHFRVEGVGKPLSIPTVIVSAPLAPWHELLLVKSELCGSKALIPLSDFLSSSRSIYDPGWLPYRIASFVVGKPLWWALGQLGIVDNHANAFGDSSTAERWKKVKGDYVAIKLLEQAAERILERQRQKDVGNLADSLYNAESFREEFASCAFEDALLSELDVKVLLKFLERDRHSIVIIKFVESGVSESLDITAVDSGLLALKTAVQKLQAQVDSLQRRIDERTRLASEALRQKRKETALTHLRARKLLEDVHKKRLGSLDLLEATLLRVETSAGDIDIMKSYESSTVTLREILSHPLLQREKIDETMDAMASATADAREIDGAIQLGAEMAQADAGVDDDALEDELAALVRDVEREKSDAAAEEQHRRLAAGGLDVPVHEPVLPESQEVEAARKQLERVAA